MFSWVILRGNYILNDFDQNRWLISPWVQYYSLPALLTCRYLEPPPQRDTHTRGFYALNFTFSEASTGETGSSHHPCLQKSLCKKQMITPKAQTLHPTISVVSDGVLDLHSAAVSKDGSNNGNKLLLWTGSVWGFSWKLMKVNWQD